MAWCERVANEQGGIDQLHANEVRKQQLAFQQQMRSMVNNLGNYGPPAPPASFVRPITNMDYALEGIRGFGGAAMAIGGGVLFPTPWAPLGAALAAYGTGEMALAGQNIKKLNGAGGVGSLTPEDLFGSTGRELARTLATSAGYKEGDAGYTAFQYGGTTLDVGSVLGSLATPFLASRFSGLGGVADDASRVGIGESAIGTDYIDDVGRLGGQIYSPEKLAQLEQYLARRGVTLKVGDEFLKQGKAGGFARDGSELILRNNPTQYEVWHELAHFTQYRKIGPEAYLTLPRSLTYNAPEQFVFDLLENSPRRWNALNLQERQHAIDYIERIGGFR